MTKRQEQTFTVSYEIPTGLFWGIDAHDVMEALRAHYATVSYPQITDTIAVRQEDRK